MNIWIKGNIILWKGREAQFLSPKSHVKLDTILKLSLYRQSHSLRLLGGAPIVQEPRPLDPSTPWGDGVFRGVVTIPKTPAPTLSPFQQAVQAARREGDLDALILPVIMTEVLPNAQLPQGGVQFEHTPLSLSKLLRRLNRHALHGTTSPCITGLIQGLAQSERLIPYDSEMIARTCLSTSEFLQF